MPIDETANAFERQDAARDAANERAHRIAFRHWRYPWCNKPPESPPDLPEPPEQPIDGDDA